ncbi:universal stress protein [Acaricomes phytoseiuli]|uniref:universal stress protein n=1 Tax=Acaricomes phytoseiuli TaxID=291968 RepID=UPI00035EBAF2|nr:universal stress protein [Acaricomes phytoseiuli]MCW1250567.1 universal stress protein [Acaricomes phytoseiuli]
MTDSGDAKVEAESAPVAPTGIVVGVDGSEHGDCALLWAVQEARQRQQTLHIVTAYSVPIFAASGLDGGSATVDEEVIAQGARAIVEQAMQRVAGAGVDFDARVVSGDPSSVLQQMSKTAELLVFGSRGRGGFVGRLLGSVSSALPAHSLCPTVTVPLSCADRLNEPGKTAQTPAQARIHPMVSVGVDGSQQARYAVLQAAEEAQRCGYSLRVLCAVPPLTGAAAWLPSGANREELLKEIAEQLEAGKAWLQHHFPQLEITADVVDGVPVETLVEATKTSELVVLGTRGHGGFAGMILGSTTDGVLHHAKGPVMVVRDQEDPRLDDRERFGPMLGNV